jgi:hypothetical protein
MIKPIRDDSARVKAPEEPEQTMVVEDQQNGREEIRRTKRFLS